jgi:hypothetical protein
MADVLVSFALYGQGDCVSSSRIVKLFDFVHGKPVKNKGTRKNSYLSLSAGGAILEYRS